MAYRGHYKLNHPEKYKGTLHQKGVKYLSLWERDVIKTFDNSSSIISWIAPTGTNDFSIPYQSPIDGKMHRYIPDFFIRVKKSDGGEKRVIIEVKPHAQTAPPKLPKSGRKTRRYANAYATYLINSAKWAATQFLCETKGWEFKIMTEKDLYGKSTVEQR